MLFYRVVRTLPMFSLSNNWNCFLLISGVIIISCHNKRSLDDWPLRAFDLLARFGSYWFIRYKRIVHVNQMIITRTCIYRHAMCWKHWTNLLPIEPYCPTILTVTYNGVKLHWTNRGKPWCNLSCSLKDSFRCQRTIYAWFSIRISLRAIKQY